MMDFHIVLPLYHDPVKSCNQHTDCVPEDNADMETLAQRLAAARDAKQLTQTQLAKLAGCSQGLIGNLESGIQQSSTKLPRIADVLGVTARYLQEGVPSKTPTLVALDEMAGLIPVQRVRFRLSAGVSGYAIEPENGTSKPVYFRQDWFDTHNYRPEMLFAVRVSGASMEPSLWDDDLVVVNTDDTAPHDGDVFAINYEGELVIKRLRRNAGQWYAASDNPDSTRYPAKLCTEDVRILGRVIYKQSERI